MGAWELKPWDNDGAADWFGDLFDETKLREKVLEGLNLDLGDHEEIRAAATFLIYFGRPYTWPIEHLDEDLKLAIQKLEEVKKDEVFEDLPEYHAEIDHEIELLRCRLERERTLPDNPEFQAWWRSHTE